MRAVRSVVAAGLVALLALVLLPGTAVAADNLTISWAHSDFDGDWGTLLVAIEGPADVTAITAHIIRYDTGTEVATSSAFTLRSGTATNGTWASSPFLLNDLAIYRVSVDATDAAGGTVTNPNAGELAYLVVSAFSDVRLSRATATYEDHTVTMKGRLTGRWPGTGVVRPLAAAPVTLQGELNWADMVTGPDGRFTGSVEVIRDQESIWAQYLGTNPLAINGSRTGDFFATIRPRQTRLTVAVSPGTVNRYQNITVTGQLTWKTPAGWEPIPNSSVFAFTCTVLGCGQFQGTVPADATGAYQMSFPPIESGYVQVGFNANDPYVEPATNTRTFRVIQPAAFSEFGAARLDPLRVEVFGRLAFDGGFSPASAPVQLQYSRTGTGGWQTLTTVQVVSYHFDVVVERSTPGFWRAVYDDPSNVFQRAVSPVVAVP